VPASIPRFLLVCPSSFAQLLRIITISKTHPANVGNYCSDGIFLG
jgi:hypothetical protein